MPISPNEKEVMARLVSSIDELEDALVKAKNSIPKHYSERLNDYDKIIETQRTFIDQLSAAFEAGTYGEVYRLVTLINGLTTMIRDDARDILKDLQNNLEK